VVVAMEKKWKPYSDEVMAKLCKKWKKIVGVWKRKEANLGSYVLPELQMKA